MVVVWTVSQGDQEYPAPRYHPPSEAPHRAPSESPVMLRSMHITIVYSRAIALDRDAPALVFTFKLCERSQTSTIIFNCMTGG